MVTRQVLQKVLKTLLPDVCDTCWFALPSSLPAQWLSTAPPPGSRRSPRVLAQTRPCPAAESRHSPTTMASSAFTPGEPCSLKCLRKCRGGELRGGGRAERLRWRCKLDYQKDFLVPARGAVLQRSQRRRGSRGPLSHPNQLFCAGRDAVKVRPPSVSMEDRGTKKAPGLALPPLPLTCQHLCPPFPGR